MPKVSGKMNERECAICDRVRQFRESIKWPQPAFAHELGITRDQLASIEYRRTPLKFETGYRLCWMFNVNQEWLVTGSGTVTPFTLENEFPTPSQIPNHMLFSEVYDSGFAFFSKLSSDVEVETKSGAEKDVKKQLQEVWPDFDPLGFIVSRALDVLKNSHFESDYQKQEFAIEIGRLIDITAFKYRQKKIARRIRKQGTGSLQNKGWIDLSKIDVNKVKRVMELKNKIQKMEGDLLILNEDLNDLTSRHA